jgi:hypothetical protein
MAYYAHRDHKDKKTEEFLLSIGAVKIDDCSEKHSVWSLFYRRIYIPLEKPVHHVGDLINVVHSQAYNEGMGAGKQEAITIIHQHISDLVFDRKK